MFRDKMDKCTHMLTAYIGSSYDYCDFIDTQLDDFIIEYGEKVVESCLHQVMVLVSIIRQIFSRKPFLVLSTFTLIYW
ncbi:hypothetical protein PIT23_000457 [Clostridioides difficile]|nr:hypothetical protein [Clostridioides difficile]